MRCCLIRDKLWAWLLWVRFDDYVSEAFPRPTWILVEPTVFGSSIQPNRRQLHPRTASASRQSRSKLYESIEFTLDTLFLRCLDGS